MTDDQWESCAHLMEQCWRGEFDDDRRDAYRMFLDKFEPEHVIAALHKIAEDGKPFLPAAAEIVKACREMTEDPVPGWGEVFRWLMRAQAVAAREFSESDNGKTTVGALWLEERCHPVVARFYESEGYGRLSRIGFNDEDYGELRKKELQDRWTEFVGVAKERLARGRALEAVGERRQLGPTRLADVALLERITQERKQLEAKNSSE